MEFVAKVKIKGKEEARGILDAFWDEFNPNSVIHIEGGEASLKICFSEDLLPKKISAALSVCDDLEFHYDGAALSKANLDESDADEAALNAMIPDVTEAESGEHVEPEAKAEETAPEEIAAESLSENNPAIVEDATSKKATSDEAVNQKNKTRRVGRVKDASKLENEKIIEFVEKASSFEEFVNLIADWINPKNRKELFVQHAMAAISMDVINWTDLDKEAVKNGFRSNLGDRNIMSGAVTEKMKDTKNPLRILELFAAIALYKDFDFRANTRESTGSADNEKSEEAESDSSDDEESHQTNDSEEEIEKIPENYLEIDFLKELFDGIKNYSIKGKIISILNNMGMMFVPANYQEKVILYIETAVNTKVAKDASEDDFYEIIREKADISKEVFDAVRLFLARIIRDYLVKNGLSNTVTTREFIQLLQKEIQS